MTIDKDPFTKFYCCACGAESYLIRPCSRSKCDECVSKKVRINNAVNIKQYEKEIVRL